MRENSTSENSPYLWKFAASRAEMPEIGGWYSAEEDMWILATELGEIPAIDAPNAAVGIVSKTMVQQEADDVKEFELLELGTKTDANQESDDKATLEMLELTTKTHAQLESDDTSPAFSF